MVFKKVRDILCDQFAADEDEISLSTNLYEDLYADELDMVDVIVTIEEAFDISIPDSEVKKMKTVGDLVTYVKAHRKWRLFR